MSSWEPSPVEARDRGLERLRGWTTFSAVLAAGLAAVFAFVAAETFPGRGAAAAAGSPSSTAAQPSSDSQGAVQPQAPPQGFFGSGSSSSSSGGGRVRTGAS
jgi:hypothetical protein